VAQFAAMGSTTDLLFFSRAAAQQVAQQVEANLAEVDFAPAGGSIDDAARFAALLIANANARTAVFAPGTYNWATPCAIPSNTRIRGSKGVRIVSTIPYDANNPFAAVFYGQPVASGVTGTLSGAAKEGDSTITTALALPAGTIFRIDADAGADPLGNLQRYYVSRGQSGSTVTLDRPLRTPFATSCVVRIYTSISQDITIDGGGMSIGGTGSRYYEFGGAARVKIDNIAFDFNSGCLGIGGVMGSFDIGCVDCHGTRLTGDGSGAITVVTTSGTSPPALTITGVPTGKFGSVQVRVTLGGPRGTWTGTWSIDGGTTTTAFTSASTVAMTGSGLTLNIAIGTANVDNQWTTGVSSGFLIEGAENCSLGTKEHPIVTRNVGGEGVAAYDCVSFTIWGDCSGSSICGAALHSNDLGCLDGFVGGTYNGNQQFGVLASAGDNRCVIEADCGFNIVAGIKVASPLGSIELRSPRCHGNFTNILIASGSKRTRITGIARCKTSIGRDVDVNADASFDRLDLTVTQGTTLRVFAGVCRIGELFVDDSGGTGVTTIFNDATLYIERGVYTGGTPVHALYTDGTLLSIRDWESLGSPTNDVTVTAGTLRVGANCSLPTKINATGGTVLLQQIGAVPVTVTSADVTLTNAQAQAQTIETIGVLTGNRNVIALTIKGLRYVFRNLNTGGFTTTIKTAAGAGISVVANDEAFVECDGTNYVRVSPNSVLTP
jgi:hypothetical protein